ncbi:MAG: ABC transporter permease subunit, partial [Alphaproteobacteria bacterium]|nr:ABC transporter permease subunit [Alphaproteobacteria bacterium]
MAVTQTAGTGWPDRLRRLLRGRGPRGLALQVAVAVILLALIVFFAANVAHNLETRGIASGFAFLGQPAGYDIAMSLVPYDPYATHARVFVVGMLNTLLVSVLAILACTVIGVVLGVLRLSGNWLVEQIVTVIIEVVRNVPLLLQIFFWYAVLLNLPNVRESLSLGGAVFINRRGVSLPALSFEPGMGWVLAAFLA